MSHGQSFIQKSVRTLLVVLVLFGQALAFESLPPVVGDIDLDANQNAFLGYPPVTADNQVLISRRQYLINWSTGLRGPQWVSWKLNKRSFGEVRRTNVFRFDHDLSEYLAESDVRAVAPQEYKGSCIDRGHQVASGDRTANVTDNEATFIMSNIMPQSAYLNRRSWVSLERFLRNAVFEQGKEIYVISGGSGKSFGKMGINRDIQLQSSNFKIAVIKPAGHADIPLSEMRLLVVDMPNTTSTGTNPITDTEQACLDSKHMMRLSDSNRTAYWRRFATTLARVGTTSGLDFSHLDGIPELTSDEIDEMVSEQMSRSFDSFNVTNLVRQAVESF